MFTERNGTCIKYKMREKIELAIPKENSLLGIGYS
jgi:hypothetical protein